MGIYDRDYVNSSRGMGASGGGMRGPSHWSNPRAWSITTWIIVSNLVVHFLAVVVFPSSDPRDPMQGLLYRYGHLSVYWAFMKLEVWRLITFQFLHSPIGLSHLLFNMFGLWVFGPMVERHLGRKKYLAFYLMCGLAGGILFTILTVLGMLPNGVHSQLIGASAGVFGVIVACAYVAPHSVIQLLFPPIPMKMRTFAYGYVAFAFLSLLFGTKNAGGQAAHVGGAIAGFFFIRHSGVLNDFFDIFGDSRTPKQIKQRGKAKKQSSYRNYNNTNAKGPSQDDIDKILQKVSQKGLASLTEKEKKVLAQASKSDD